ncbi:hypothetical protein AB0D62_13490 [Streptomyces massasporeus]
MSDGTAVRLEPHEIALLGEGPRAAVTVATSGSCGTSVPCRRAGRA